MSEPQRPGGPAITRRRRVPGGADNVLVRTVGRVPARVRTKLLLAFLGIVLLLVLLGVLALLVLGDSNARVERLGRVQQRAGAYRGLETEAEQVRVLLALRAGGADIWRLFQGGRPVLQPSGRSVVSIDRTISATLARLGQEAAVRHLGFTPPPDEEELMRQIRRDNRDLEEAMRRITRFDRSGRPNRGYELQSAEAEPLVNGLSLLTRRLVETTQIETDTLITENRSAVAFSRNLFIGVGAGGIVLALLLGFVLSRSLIGPIQRVEARVAGIASGDFSEHVQVENRDELGVLAANVNRMNDELERLYGELETTSRHKSEFLANMSHELRTPMNAIIGFSEVLREQMFGELNEAQLGYVSDIVDAGQHLLSLINDILDLSKVEAGRMELELGEVSVPQVLKNGLTLHSERAGLGGVTLGLSVDPDVGVIRADERKLRQVVFNLLANAVKFTPSGGRVDIAASVTDGMVEVAVADTGPGIDPEDQERIFEAFQQARGASTAQEGTGLGLTLSRNFVEMHGGRLWVESEPGVGSTFRFTLPLSQTG